MFLIIDNSFTGLKAWAIKSVWSEIYQWDYLQIQSS